MPRCHRCKREQATAELRRTTLGWLCKDNSIGTRCWQIVRAAKQAARERQHEERAAAAACRVATASRAGEPEAASTSGRAER